MEKRTYTAGEAAKQAICAALKERMAQKPLNKITVTELMQACGMARQHFYYHFEDIYDAVRWMFEEEAVALLREHEGVMLWQDGLLQLFQYLQENRAVCLCALHSMGREHLKRFFQSDIHAIIQNTIPRCLPSFPALLRGGAPPAPQLRFPLSPLRTHVSSKPLGWLLCQAQAEATMVFRSL